MGEGGGGALLYLIDALPYVFRAYFALPERLSAQGQPVHAVYGFAAFLIQLLRQEPLTHVAVAFDDTEEKAMNRVRPYHDERYKWFAPFGFVRYTDEQGRMWGTPGAPTRLPTVEDGVQQKAWLCGPPERFIEYLHELEGKYPGLEHVMFQYPEVDLIT